jgi:hypothetical protein
MQEKSHVLSYTEVLLVPLTTPDFSMPYNVIGDGESTKLSSCWIGC